MEMHVIPMRSLGDLSPMMIGRMCPESAAWTSMACGTVKSSGPERPLLCEPISRTLQA
jgi:hypothetical protein